MKSILTAAAMLCAILCSAQTMHLTIDSTSQKYIYTEIIKCDSTLSDTMLFFLLKDWANTQGLNLNRLKDDKGEEKQVASAMFGAKYVSFTPIDLQYKNKNVIKSEQPEMKKLVLNGVYKYTSNLYSCFQTSYSNFDVILQYKRGRAKVTFTNYTLDMYNSYTAEPMPTSGITLEKFIKEEVPQTGKPCKERASEYSVELQKHCTIILTELRKFLASIKTEEKDNW